MAERTTIRQPAVDDCPIALPVSAKLLQPAKDAEWGIFDRDGGRVFSIHIPYEYGLPSHPLHAGAMRVLRRKADWIVAALNHSMIQESAELAAVRDALAAELTKAEAEAKRLRKALATVIRLIEDAVGRMDAWNDTRDEIESIARAALESLK